MHETQAPPPLQTWFTPQDVPAAMGVAESMHCSVPVAQLVTPARHVFGLEEQARPAVQALQVPPLQTMFVPQLVPFGFGAASTQVSAPVEHDVVPA